MTGNAQLQELIDLGRQQLALLQRIAEALEASTPTTAPNYTYDLAEYPGFDWGVIGATVKAADEHGATAVLWKGHLYTRRSPQNKFGAAIWFSRAVGKADDGTVQSRCPNGTQYARLVTFKEIAEADPLPGKLAGLLRHART